MADTGELTTLIQSISSTVFDLVRDTAGTVEDFGIPGGINVFNPNVDFFTGTDGLSALTGLGETDFGLYMPDLTN
jgi:hypothetical protein